jgi:hypothetical protein
MTPDLTEELIAEGMARAGNAACSPTNERCPTLPCDVATTQ